MLSISLVSFSKYINSVLFLFLAVLDISQHVELYESVMHIVAALALSPKSVDGKKEEDEITTLLSEPESGYSMNTMLKKLYDCVSAYLTRLAVESNETRLQK